MNVSRILWKLFARITKSQLQTLKSLSSACCTLVLPAPGKSISEAALQTLPTDNTTKRGHEPQCIIQVQSEDHNVHVISECGRVFVRWWQWWRVASMKQKHFWDIFVTGCTKSCYFDNFSAANDDNVIKMTTFLSQWWTKKLLNITQITKFMGPTWGPPGSCRPQMSPMLTLWTLLSGLLNLTMPILTKCEWYYFNWYSILSGHLTDMKYQVQSYVLQHFGTTLLFKFQYDFNM